MILHRNSLLNHLIKRVSHKVYFEMNTKTATPKVYFGHYFYKKHIWMSEIVTPPTSLDGLMQEAPATLVHHIHIGFVVNQSGGNAFQFTRECQV